jgi:predicted nucleotidyltransferase component of viral defense system
LKPWDETIVKKHNPTNMPASVHNRLLNLARETKRPFNELLQYYAMERFLFRLGASEHADSFVLKGALMLRVWNLPLARPTMDIDMLGRTPNSVDDLAEIIKQCLTVETPDDGVSFDATSIKSEPIALDKKYQGFRIRVRGNLGNARLSLQLDFGFGDIVVPGPVEIEYPELLDFGKPHLLGYTLESAIAEKFQAMIELEMANTRLKDFFDLWKLSQTLHFDGSILASAMNATFRQRGTPLPTSPPPALTEIFSADLTKQSQWKAFLRKGRLESEAGMLAEIVKEIADFLLPPAYEAANGGPFRKSWPPGGPWG